MKRLIICLLLVGVVGCAKSEQASIAALEKLGASIRTNEFGGKVIRLSLSNFQQASIGAR